MMKRQVNVLLTAILCSAFIACSSDDDEIETKPKPEVSTITITGIRDSYQTTRCKVLTIEPTIEDFDGGTSKWTLTNNELDIKDSIISNENKLSFITVAPGSYQITLNATKSAISGSITTTVVVENETTAYSAYIAEVFDFKPAVGQFTNKLPAYTEGSTYSDMVKKAGDMIKGEKPAGMISLGGYGGYVVFGFDHTIANIPGKRDFRVLGNAFWAAYNPNSEASKRGGACEPGIVMVAYDTNQNGKPDEDEWYEIAGSEYHKSTTIKNYEITYYKPNPNKAPVTDPEIPLAIDLEYVRWTDNQGKGGYKIKNTYHAQNYYTNWITDNSITFKGTLLPNNGVNENKEKGGEYWVQYAYEYGYADNVPNNDDDSAIDINWAVDKSGNKVNLPGVDFIKVYTGVNQECGWVGEASTEVSGAYDLHLLNMTIPTR